MTQEPIRNYRVIPPDCCALPSDLDARALKARLVEVQDSERHQGELILRLYRKIEKLEAVAEAAREQVRRHGDETLFVLVRAVHKLDAKEGA